jgi:hypothetical protein
VRRYSGFVTFPGFIVEVKHHSIDSRLNQGHCAAYDNAASQQVSDGKGHTEMQDGKSKCLNHGFSLGQLVNLNDNHY